MEYTLRIYKLGETENVPSFDCGDEDLNEFILHEAMDYRKALLAVTYIVVKEDTKQVIAYFSLANDRVSLSDFENKTQFNRFRTRRFVNEKRMKSYPAAKLCRLGVDVSVRGSGIGSYILDMLKSYFVVDNKTGCRFLTVDAYRDALPFYERNKFVPLNNNDEGSHTRLLFFDLNDIADN